MVHSQTKMLLASLGIFAVLSLSSCTSLQQKQEDPYSKLTDSYIARQKVFLEHVKEYGDKLAETKQREKSLWSHLSDAQLAAYIEVTKSWDDDARNELALRRLRSVTRGASKELLDRLDNVLTELRILREWDARLELENRELHEYNEDIRRLIQELP